MSYLLAAILTGSVLLAQEPAPPQPAGSSPLLVEAQELAMSRRDWKRLRGQARTAGDFDRLARYAAQRAALYQQKEAACQSELRDYYSHTWGVPEPKFPPRDQTLRNLIESYRKSSVAWSHHAEDWTRRAEALRKS